MHKLTLFTVTGLMFLGLMSCSDSSTNTEPPEKQVTFPLKFSFVNTSDPDPTRIDVRFGAHWPKKDSTTYVLTGAGGAGVGQVIDHTMERIGYPGCEMVMIFSVNKIWKDRNKEYPTYKWYIVDNRTVHDSSGAVMSVKWPEDTTRADIHQFDPDTVDENTPMRATF